MRKALSVGIDHYPGAQLNGCVNDASAFKAVMEVNGDGSPNFDVKLLTDVPTKSELKAAIIDLFAGEVEVALLYFSGHGYLDMLGGYIVTPDFTKHDFGVSMDEILVIANNSKAKDKVIILDCCHSGALGTPRVSGGITSNIIEGVSILTASRDSEASLEINGHGVFTSLLLAALRGGAADIRGHVTPGSVYAYVDQALGPWEQRPVFKTNVSNFTSLRKITPLVPLEVLRKITEYFPSPEEAYQLDPSYEFTNSSKEVHSLIEPFAKAENVAVFKNLQEFQRVGLVVPVDAPYMYFAAMESKSCALTALGYHYWKLVKNRRI